jgi:thiopeptide-type bacteriocin biosynthesis protein
MAGPDAAKFALRNATLRHLAVQALRDRRLGVEIDEATLSKLGPIRPQATTAPVSLDLAVSVLARSAADLDAGDFRLIIAPNVGAQAAGRNLGRFADLLNGPAVNALADVATSEIEHGPADLHAELVYLPRRGRSANVAIRPAVYPHEIIVTTMPGVDQRRAIPLSELLVGVRDDCFYVRWPQAPGDLHVHAGHMLTSRWAPPACRFLEECAGGERMPLNPFQWGPAGDLPFLPRIEIDSIVLSPAQWQIDVAQRDATLHPDSEQFHAMLARWRSDWTVPRRVYLTAGDNRLLLDLDAPAQAEQLRKELRRLGDDRVVVLQEPLPGPEHAWLEGPHGHHLAELVVPLVQRATSSAPAGAERRPPTAPLAAIDRLRPPGSEWLYAKLYCPGDRHDELLAGAVRSFAEFTIASGLAERWFFLRYADPEPHVRVRFAGDPDRLVGSLLPRVCAWAQDLLAQGQCSRLAFDTYEREIERYGGPAAMASAEEIFAVDSATAVEMLHHARSGEFAVDRTTLTVLSVDELLAALGLDVARRLALYRDAVATRHETGDEYRRRKQALRRILGNRRTGDDDLHVLLARVLHVRETALAAPAQRLRALSAAGELTKPLERIFQSLVHVHCNRLLGGEPPTEQHVLGLLLRTREGLERAPLTGG